MLGIFEKWKPNFKAKEIEQLGIGQRTVCGISSMDKHFPDSSPRLPRGLVVTTQMNSLWWLVSEEDEEKNSFLVNSS